MQESVEPIVRQLIAVVTTYGLEVIGAIPFDFMRMHCEPGQVDQNDHASQWTVALGLAFKGFDTVSTPTDVTHDRRLRMVPALGPA